jgi:DnaD/phage-associated family protein
MTLRFSYGTGVLNLPEAVLSHADRAGKRELRVLLTISALLPCEEDALVTSVAERTGLSITEASSAIAFWRGTGVVLTGESRSDAVQATTQAEPTAKAEKKPLPDKGLPTYSANELSHILESRREFASLIDACQQTFGKIFNAAEVGIIAGMIDYLGVDGEFVLLLLSHCVRMEKKSLRYAEKTAISLFDEGVTDAAALEERLARIESLSTALGQIRAMFGAASRALSTKEKRMIEQWVLVMKYDMDVLKLAYDATVDAIHEPSFAYANTILDRWYAAGYRTAEDVEAALAEYRRQKEGKSNGFDLDDFFEAALKKTYGEQ